MEWLKPGVIAGSVIYSLLGVAIFWICFIIIDKLTPFKLWDELVQKQNTALAILVAAMCLGIAIIVASAIH